MNRLICLLALTIVLTGSCRSDDEVLLNNPDSAIIVATPPTTESDPFKLESVSAEGTIVTAVVRYGGGCEEHRFSVYWNGVATKSIPPQMMVDVHHDDRGDTCEAYLTDTVRFDAKELLSDNWNLEAAAILIIRNTSDGETLSVTAKKE
ncbi:MAG: hypothetical protein WA958_11935 [Tunicatimonas sp.]